MNRHFTEKHIQAANKHMKICSASSGIKEMQIKHKMRYYYYTPIRMAKITNSDNTNADEHLGSHHPYFASRNVK